VSHSLEGNSLREVIVVIHVWKVITPKTNLSLADLVYLSLPGVEIPSNTGIILVVLVIANIIVVVDIAAAEFHFDLWFFSCVIIY
jgi:hypothetical protein